MLYLVANQAQIGWLYLIDSMLWSIVVVSAIFPWWSLKSLRIERQILVPHRDRASPTEDGTVEVRLKVRNAGRLARYFIKVVDDCPLDEPGKHRKVFFVPSLRPGVIEPLSYTVTCYRRGHYEFATASLETAAPLGLFIRRRHYDLPLNVTVYPAYYEMNAMASASESWADQGQTAISSAATEFYGSREYHHGDSLKHIHWRNTARLGQFVVKQFEEARHGAVAVAFETKLDHGVGRETTLEYSVKIAASLARYSESSGRGISILAGPTPLSGTNWLDAMDYLAGITIGTPASLEELAKSVAPGETFVAIVSATETSLIPGLRRLAGGRQRLVLVLLEGFDPSENPHEFVSGLSGSNYDIVRCSRGNLREALVALSHSRVLGSELPAAVS